MTRRIFNFTAIATIALSALLTQVTIASAKEYFERQDLLAVFEQFGVKGTFALYDATHDHLITVNSDRASVRRIPASTFKIMNSLIALETGVVENEGEIFLYDGTPQPLKSWERAMSMRDAIQVSNVPIYQEIARRVGLQRYSTWLATLDYGNHEIGGDVETFWLRGPLKISAAEQVNFLDRLAHRTLPLSLRSQIIVADILKLEHRNGRTLYGKTGWGTAPSPQVGWFVGWVENETGIFAFALNIDVLSRDDLRKRKLVAKSLLAKLGVY